MVLLLLGAFLQPPSTKGIMGQRSGIGAQNGARLEAGAACDSELIARCHTFEAAAVAASLTSLLPSN